MDRQFWGYSVLLAATLVIGVAVALALVQAQRTAERNGRDLVAAQAEVVARNVESEVNSYKDTALQQLRASSAAEFEAALNHPLVRNVFYWTADRGLIYPKPTQLFSFEQRQFLRRYDRLFANTDFAKQSNENQRQVKGQTHWIPWFWEDGMYLLGWHGNHSEVLGVELEMAMVLAQMLPKLKSPSQSAMFRIIDDQGRIVFITGGEAELGSPTTMTVPVGDALPHWSIEAVQITPLGWSNWTRATAWLLVLLSIASIVLSGRYLTQRARFGMEQAMQRSNFVSNVSHELKTPLTSIRMYAELMAEGRVTQPEKIDEYLSVIVEESQRLTRLVNNVLTFGRLERGHQQLTQEFVDLGKLIDRIQRHLGPLLEEKDCVLRTEIQGDIQSINTDPDALEQILWNLIDNAIKYGVIEGEVCRVEIRVLQNSNGIQIEVLDRGPGLSQRAAAKVFDPFFRVQDQLTSRHAGTGIGLSIARGLARRIGGELTFRPRQGGGSCFTLNLPRKDCPGES